MLVKRSKDLSNSDTPECVVKARFVQKVQNDLMVKIKKVIGGRQKRPIGIFLKTTQNIFVE